MIRVETSLIKILTWNLQEVAVKCEGGCGDVQEVGAGLGHHSIHPLSLHKLFLWPQEWDGLVFELL